ncbi:hypothetical protein NC651_002270 [Populus alba x Populus x berolinensis]|nr:hypothetical protein NC651_002270 [Populus alba x Populus x berolinensis]
MVIFKPPSSYNWKQKKTIQPLISAVSFRYPRVTILLHVDSRNHSRCFHSTIKLSTFLPLTSQKKSEEEVRDIQWRCLHHNHSRYKASTYSHLGVIFYMCMLLQRQAPVFPLCSMKLTYSVVRCVDLLSPNLVTGVLSLATDIE